MFHPMSILRFGVRLVWGLVVASASFFLWQQIFDRTRCVTG